MAYGGAGPVLGYKAGAHRPATFTGDQTGIQAMLDHIGVGGHGYIGPGSYANLTNFTQYAKSRVTGAGPLATLLTRSSGATGTFWREKTAGEGNSSGATGIILQNLGLYGNGSAGDGLNLGNQGGPSFNANAYLGHILVRDFPSGTAIKLLANAIRCSDIWGIASLNGGVIDGGANHISGGWWEGNTAIQLQVLSPWNTFDHTQIEQTGTAPSDSLIKMGALADKNLFNGLYMSMEANLTHLIFEVSGAANNRYLMVRVNTNGFTYTNTIYNEVWSAGTGAKDHIPEWMDSANAAFSYFYDKSTNRAFNVIGPKVTESVITLTDVATILVNANQGNFFTVTLAGNRTMDAPTNPHTGQRITFDISQDATGGRTLAWNAAFKHVWSDTGNTASKRSTISFWYNGTNWMQVGAQSAYI